MLFLSGSQPFVLKVNHSSDNRDFSEFKFVEIDVAVELLLELLRYYLNIVLRISPLDGFESIDHQLQVTILRKQYVTFALLIIYRGACAHFQLKVVLI